MTSHKAAKPYTFRLMRILLGITAFLLAAHMTLQYLNWEVFYQQNGQVYELANRFDLDDESSVATWFSQLLFLTIGVGALLAGYLEKKVAVRRLWQLIGIAGLLFSVDEIAGIHEFVLQSLHNTFFRDESPTGLGNAWWLVLPFILIAAAWLLGKMTRLLPRRTMVLFAAAIATFLVGAIGVDLLTSLVERESFLHQGVLVGIEEILELSGSLIVLYAIVDYLEAHHHKVFNKSLEQLKLARQHKRD